MFKVDLSVIATKTELIVFKYSWKDIVQHTSFQEYCG
jgi:hypothetical protein